MLNQNVRTIVDLCRYHVSAENLPNALPVILATGVLGLALCLGGAKSIRTIATASFGVLGALLGIFLGSRTSLPPWVTVTLGTVILAYAGNVLYRIWVGVGSAIMLTLVVMTIYGGHTVMPSFHEFNRAIQKTPIGDVEFSVGALHQARLKHTAPYEYFAKFWESFKQNEVKWKLHLSLLTVSAALAGLVFGSLAPKFSSALWTSAVGTICLAISVITGTMCVNPAAEQNYLTHTDWIGWTLLFGIAMSTWLQWRTLKKPRKKPIGAGGSGGSGGGASR